MQLILPLIQNIVGICERLQFPVINERDIHLRVILEFLLYCIQYLCSDRNMHMKFKTHFTLWPNVKRGAHYIALFAKTIVKLQKPPFVPENY
jgi:hypothetical protein